MVQLSQESVATRAKPPRKPRKPANGQAAADALGAATTLAVFRALPGTLTLRDRKVIVEQALVLLEQNYAHLPLKVAMHAVNPVQQLRVLRSRLEHQTDATMEPEWVFHRRMSSVFHSVRDLHTNYLLPVPYKGKIAYLPFLVERCYRADGTESYLVTHTVSGFGPPQFGPGAEVTHWSGMPIARAAAVNGARFAGSNEAANLARGVESLTLRPMVIQLPPDEDWVTVSYVGLDGVAAELRADWQVSDNPPPMADLDAVNDTAALLGVDLDSDEKTRAKKLLFAPAVMQLEAGITSAQLDEPAAVGAADVATTMPGVFRAREVTTPSGTFGQIRIFTFSVNDPIAFRDEFVRLAGLLPQIGLIVDVRDNGGGHIYASEFTLQTMTPRRITPEPVQFLSSPLNLKVCRRHKDNPSGIDLGPWFRSLDEATETGATFSAAWPISPEDGANEVGQTYHGPVVLITDARCYSATDIFAAGFADHQLGTTLGVDDNTGAGGANVWTHALLAQLMQLPTADASSPYTALPNGTNMRVAIRRTLRVGALSGTPVEDLGVKPDHLHKLTPDDLLHDNVDLLGAAGALLAAMPVRKLEVTVSLTGSTLDVDLDVANVDRADFYLDDRPSCSIDITAATATATLPAAAAGQVLRVEAFQAGNLVASRMVTI